MNNVPTRKISNQGSKKNTGYFPSSKNQRSIAFESLIELDFIQLLEFDDDVISYTEQPMTINYIASKKAYKYTPDFLVIRKNSTQLIEIKPESKLHKILQDDQASKKYYAAAEYCKNKGYSGFFIITDKDIRSGNKLKNIQYLFAFSKLIVPASIKLKIRNQLIIDGPQQINQLINSLTEDTIIYTKYFSYVLSMLCHYDIKTNLLKPIGKNSLVEIKR